MKKPRVIVLVFSGEEPDAGVLATIAANIGAMCNTDQVDPFVLNPGDIASAVLSGLQLNIPGQTKESECKTPEDNAAVLIGGLMKKVLGKDYSPRLFMSQLIEKINGAKKRPNNQLNREFMNALFILSQPDLNLSRAILTETHLDEDKIAIIRDTYNLMQKYE